MKKTAVLKQLAALGTAQNRKVYGRHGVQDTMYGVSYADLGKLKKAIQVDHALAESLWKSGNHDARVLASMIADPARMTGAKLEEWVAQCENYILADAVSGVASKSAHAEQKMKKWTKARGEWIASIGWNVLTSLAMTENDLTDDFFEEYLGRIENGIHSARNRTRYAMNNALIAIGVRCAKLEKLAIATAKRIGKVEVDHGETSCKTPDAAPYIKKARAHVKAKLARARARAKAKVKAR
ncbi:MAG: DNA alkylation repair protein [Planctomycetota bacterium]|nr:MAG: DNA alkylation repair protein [Planctomycetota bacterium]